MAFAIILCFAAFALGSSSEESTTATQGIGAAAQATEDNTALGKYSVEINSTTGDEYYSQETENAHKMLRVPFGNENNAYRKIQNDHNNPVPLLRELVESISTTFPG